MAVCRCCSASQGSLADRAAREPTEQLFGAGYAACFTGAIKLVGRQTRVARPDDRPVTARVGMGPVPQGCAPAVELIVSLPGVEAGPAREIVGAAHLRCPYSHATRGDIDVKPSVV